MARSSSVYGSISYVSKPKKLRTAKLDDTALNPDGALFMWLDTTKCHLADKANGCYDTKPVHYLSMSSEELKWDVCEKYVYNVDTGAKETLQFLKICYINN